MTVALLITTYNWPEALELVLQSVLNQSRLPDELIIADDGSTDETRLLINKFRSLFSNELTHVWQEDRGFRKSEILNRALKICNSDYIVQIDGDCILHKHFIKDHVRFSEPKVYLYGSRVNTKESFIEDLFNKKKTEFSPFDKQISKRTRAIYLPVLSKTYKPTNDLSSKIRGCNFSFWRKDALAIRGYDEIYKGWGKEDSDFAARLLHNGILGKRIRYAGIVYHLWHKEAEKDHISISNSYLKSVLEEKRIYPQEGMANDKNL